MSIAEKLTAIAENEQSVYEAGQTAEWKELWDGLQSYGERTEYDRFCIAKNFIIKDKGEPYWNFYPKYDLNITRAPAMFRAFNNENSSALYPSVQIDLTERLNSLGVRLNTSNATDLSMMFYMCQGLTRVPFLDLTSATNLNSFIGYTSITTIDGIRSSETTNWASNSFSSYCSLQHCIFSGIIAKSLNLSKTQLDYESLVSIKNCLKDVSEAGTTLTLALGTLADKLSDAEKAEITQKGWTLA